jgi:uncharacterized protein with gpF-like domain
MAAITSVKFDERLVSRAVEAEIRATVDGLAEIDRGSLQGIYEASLVSVRAGGDLHSLTTVLQSVGVPTRRAGEIARHISFRSTSIITRERQVSLGVVTAIWKHSGAPCLPEAGANAPELALRSADHEAAHGERYSVLEGYLMRGRRTWPGQDLGCKCFSKPVVPGLD